MTVNLTDFINADAAENGWALKGWWCGWIGERVDVIPLGDSKIHISPQCPCKPTHELVTGRIMVVHNAFDGREGFEPEPEPPFTLFYNENGTAAKQVEGIHEQ